MLRSTLTSKGQTTIPLQVREHLGLRQGDAIDFVVQPDGSVIMRSAKRDVRSLKGLLAGAPSAALSASLEAMKAAVRDAAVERDQASMPHRTGRPRRPRGRA